MSIVIRPACRAEAEELTAIAHAAKRYWGYPEEWIRLWRRDLTVGVEQIERGTVHCADVGGRVAGFYELSREASAVELEHFWVHPDRMGRGIGAALLRHAIAAIVAGGGGRLRIAADPNAEGFYLRMGARRVGEEPSVPPGRRLPVLEIQVPPAPDPEEVLDFWFADATRSPEAARRRVELWFGASAMLDRQIVEHFGHLPDAAAGGALDAWKPEPQSALALVVVLDQFPRNAFRGTPRAFAFDAAARAVALAALEAGFAERLHPLEAAFFGLPLEHAEDLVLQHRCVAHYEWLRDRAPESFRELFAEFVDYGCRHRDVIQRFGRFPHRNRMLGRESTAEERDYLDGGGETFAALPPKTS